MEFSRPEYWSAWPFPSPGDCPNPGIKPWSPALQAVSLSSKPPGKPHNPWAVPYIPVTYLFIFLVCTKTFIYIFLIEVQFDFIVLCLNS